MSRSGDQPPRWSRTLLHWILPSEDRTHVVTEMDELYRLRVERDGPGDAARWYRRQVLGFLTRAWGLRSTNRGVRRKGPALSHSPGRRRALSEAVRHDLVFAWRQIVRRPWASLLAMAVLALTIGTGTAVFSVVDAVVLRGLPYPDPGRLVTVHQVNEGSGTRTRVSPPAFDAWSARADTRTVESIAAVIPSGMDLVSDGDPVHLNVATATHELFAVLGVSAALGRTYGRQEDVSGAAPTVVLSHELWLRRFGRSSSVVGRTIRLGGAPRTVLGVMPPGFDFPQGTEAWLPARPRLSGMLDAWGGRFLRVVARMAPSAERPAAERELARLLEGTPTEAPGVTMRRLEEALVGDMKRPLYLVLGAVLLALLVACANVGGLLLSRALTRRRELAIRTALGAARSRITSTLLAEGVILAGAAGLLGVGAAYLTLDALVALAPADLPASTPIAVDARVLTVALAATLVTGVGAGFFPALRTPPAALRALRDGRSGRSAAGPRFGLLRSGLVVSQVTVTVVLLAGAGLLGRSFLDLVSRERGFEAAGVSTANLSLPRHRFPGDEKLRSFYRDLLREAGEVPGVTGAALTRNLPLGGRSIRAPVRLEGRELRDPGPPVVVSAATPGYFDIMEIAVRRGRAFDEGDASGPGVAVVNESFARTFFPGERAVGRRFRTLLDQEMMEIVGVVADVHHRSLADAPPPLVYRVLERAPARGVHLVVRSEAPPADVLPLLRNAVRRAEPDQPVRRLASMNTLVAESVAETRFQAQMLGAFAVITLLVSALGLYALLSDLVGQLRREIGIRMAMGASPKHIGRRVARRGLAAAGLGVVLGLGGAAASGRVIESLLHGVTPTDPTTLAVVVLLLLAVASLATWPSVRRATRVDPVKVLES